MEPKRCLITCSLLALATLSLQATCAVAAGQGEGKGAGKKGGGKGKSPKQVRLESNSDYMNRWLSDLPVMSESHSPESEEWSNSFAVCSIMRNENLSDVMEWLRYYKWLGADHVFLTDNDSTNSKDVIETLTDAFSSDFLTVREEKTPKAQLKAYAWCAEEHREDYNWMAFFDMDEYLVLRGEHAADPSTGSPPDLKGFMDMYKMETGLSINWVVAGPSGIKKRPKEGGVMSHYTQCVSKPDRHVKTIANTWFLEGVANHPHNFHFRDGVGSVNEEFYRLNEVWMALPKNIEPNQWKGGKCEEAFKNKSPQLRAHCYKSAEPLYRNGTVERVALFHYATKSEEDFQNKMQRGSGMSLRAKGYDYFNEIQKKQSDAEICLEPSKLYNACCTLEGAAKMTQKLQKSRKKQEDSIEEVTTESGRSDASIKGDNRDGGTADYYLSIQTFTKHVSKKTVVQPKTGMADEAVARALFMLSSVLLASFLALVAMMALLWKGRSKSPKSFGFSKRTVSGDKIPAF